MKIRYTDISGAILAGGKNSRMGRHKAFMKVNSQRAIDLIIDTLKSLFNEIIIVTNDNNIFREFNDLVIVEDVVRGHGPLGGIYTGLKAAASNMVFFIACDMPFLHNGLIKKICKSSMEGNFDCFVPYAEEGIEPLCAIYSKAVLPRLKKALSAKDLSIRSFLKQCNCKYIEVKPDEKPSFFNINTIEDLERAKQYEDKIKNLA